MVAILTMDGVYGFGGLVMGVVKLLLRNYQRLTMAYFNLILYHAISTYTANSDY